VILYWPINATTPFHTRRKFQTFSWNCICSPLHDYVKLKLELAYQGKNGRLRLTHLRLHTNIVCHYSHALVIREIYSFFNMFWNTSLWKDEVIRIGQEEREIVCDKLKKTISGRPHNTTKLHRSFM